jgi:DNA-directed RNA polymerase subunit M/transcription elongation factor TFIIS
MDTRSQQSKTIKGKRRKVQSQLGRSYINEDKKRGCEICGYNKFIGALDYHHVRGDKVFELSSNSSRSIKAIQDEIDKCMLVCANCHRELHADNNGVYHNDTVVSKDDLNKQIHLNFYF